MSEVVVTKRRIVEDLKRLGLAAGDVVIVHSALSSLGRVEGGAQTVIEALLEVLAPAGTLVMPTFAGPRPFTAETPSGLGAITEAFRNYPGAVRSFHPTHSVACVGPKSQDLIAGHLESPTASGPDTPYGRLIELGGKILLLGVDHDRNTCMHALEECVRAPYLSDYKAGYLDDEGTEHTLLLKHFPGPHRDFIGLDPLFRKTGVQSICKVGGAVARLVDARRMREVVLEAFKGDPALVLCDNPNCADCVMQRRLIRVARLREEAFTLGALASAVSPWPDAVASELARVGVNSLVVDRLFGEPAWTLNSRQVNRAVASLDDEGIKVAAVHCPPDPSELERGVVVARAFGTRTMIAPFPPDPAGLGARAAEKGMRLLLENTTLTSRMYAQMLKDAGAGKVFAFNPAAFALMGEKPFLTAYSQTSLRRHVAMLYLTDATFGGCATLPARGNGEVKEMLSILRCRSFAGCVVIGSRPFREAVEAFWGMMDSM